MNKTNILIPLTLFLTACTSAPDIEEVQANYLDLSSKEQVKLVEEYWTILKRVEPRYPISAARNNISGCVDLIVGIGQNGKVKGYKVRSSYPKGVFDDHAAAALFKWKWKATEKNKDSAPVLTSVRLDFTTSRNPTDIEYLKNCPISEI
ncbi:energy transducer TonB [Pseudoalteromonas obscura]|uniref:Energy transducer TonB n=1 Tax=Pseudoalteromonas obscura TaxID=3048491 RepID=A0ABT7EP63_9GAMM|nr:energy transducer TonB [Pseudoalteromonas sp. P94(2023)]MDK2596844.1 energy transducer TonB [Pseudoalteromonas sp. P94(2023)]